MGQSRCDRRKTQAVSKKRLDRLCFADWGIVLWRGLSSLRRSPTFLVGPSTRRKAGSGPSSRPPGESDGARESRRAWISPPGPARRTGDNSRCRGTSRTWWSFSLRAVILPTLCNAVERLMTLHGPPARCRGPASHAATVVAIPAGRGLAQDCCHTRWPAGGPPATMAGH